MAMARGNRSFNFLLRDDKIHEHQWYGRTDLCQRFVHYNIRGNINVLTPHPVQESRKYKHNLPVSTISKILILNDCTPDSLQRPKSNPIVILDKAKHLFSTIHWKPPRFRNLSFAARRQLESLKSGQLHHIVARACAKARCQLAAGNYANDRKRITRTQGSRPGKDIGVRNKLTPRNMCSVGAAKKKEMLLYE